MNLSFIYMNCILFQFIIHLNNIYTPKIMHFSYNYSLKHTFTLTISKIYTLSVNIIIIMIQSWTGLGQGGAWTGLGQGGPWPTFAKIYNF